MYAFLSGAATMGFLIVGLFFFRFWRRTDDGLFLAFGIAFLLLGLNQALLIIAKVPDEERSWLYLLRLLAFIVILAAIFRKNRKG
ncbi:MAG: hypothetical protein J7494_12950 [Sphingobium sp.]|nr:hypothetical protein [Sphingobium sp.]